MILCFGMLKFAVLLVIVVQLPKPMYLLDPSPRYLPAINSI
jgi:hypothetical protein